VITHYTLLDPSNLISAHHGMPDQNQDPASRLRLESKQRYTDTPLPRPSAVMQITVKNRIDRSNVCIAEILRGTMGAVLPEKPLARLRSMECHTAAGYIGIPYLTPTRDAPKASVLVHRRERMFDDLDRCRMFC